MFRTPDVLYFRIMHHSRFRMDKRHVFLSSTEKKKDTVKGEKKKTHDFTLACGLK